MQRIAAVDGRGNHLTLRNLIVEGFRPISGEFEIVHRPLRLILRLADDIRHGYWLWSLRHGDGDRRIMWQCSTGIHA